MVDAQVELCCWAGGIPRDIPRDTQESLRQVGFRNNPSWKFQVHGTSLGKLVELHKLPTRRVILLILGDLGSSVAVARKMLLQREAGASWPQTGIFDPSQQFGKESRMFSTATLPESQGFYTKSAAAPAALHCPPALALHVSKALPLPALFPAASRTPFPIGVGWDSAAKQQEYVRLSRGEGGG